MSINLENYSDTELEALISKAKSITDGHKLKRKKMLMKQIRVLAKQAGVVLKVQGSKQPGSLNGQDKENSPPVVKYRNPHNENETWSGHGRKSKWLQQKIAEGQTMEEFLVT